VLFINALLHVWRVGGKERNSEEGKGRDPHEPRGGDRAASLVG